jgi:phosphorylated CTD-interacting factor 1
LGRIRGRVRVRSLEFNFESSTPNLKSKSNPNPNHRPFGSLGNFFNFFPITGSYEVNPPFIESIMTASVQHVQSLLAKDSCLSFVLIIPGWQESEAFQILEKSSYLVCRFAIAAKDHGYCSG